MKLNVYNNEQLIRHQLLINFMTIYLLGTIVDTF